MRIQVVNNNVISSLLCTFNEQMPKFFTEEISILTSTLEIEAGMGIGRAALVNSPRWQKQGVEQGVLNQKSWSCVC